MTRLFDNHCQIVGLMNLKSSPLLAKNPGSSFLSVALVLVVVLSFFFRASYLPGYTVFSNDGPLGALKAESRQLPE